MSTLESQVGTTIWNIRNLLVIGVALIISGISDGTPDPYSVDSMACSNRKTAVRSLAGAAAASQLIDRNATDVQLAVNAKGEALLTYRAHGRTQHVLVWGAVDALQPTSCRPQVRLKKDYAGGYGKCGPGCKLGEREPGIYLGEVADIAPGVWDLELEAARVSERLFRSRNRIVLK